MARAIDEEVLAKELEKHDSAFVKKAEKQAIEGKDFELDPVGYGPGVVPESVWKKQKKAGEVGVPDYVEDEE